jgi:hypothetical protein
VQLDTSKSTSHHPIFGNPRCDLISSVTAWLSLSVLCPIFPRSPVSFFFHRTMTEPSSTNPWCTGFGDSKHRRPRPSLA